jgi:hypothetical protein
MKTAETHDEQPLASLPKIVLPVVPKLREIAPLVPKVRLWERALCGRS